jgi:two-component system, chemotaxis family, CheB/CheR fusion protein
MSEISEKEKKDPEFEALIRYVQQSRGLDFRGYKRTSLRRRIQLRMAEVGVAGYGEYESFLEVHPQEFVELLNTVLINVTSFFRDREAWEVLDRDVLPRIVEGDPNRPIRVWSVGCASGEEPYSVAMLLAERMGVPEFCRRAKIYATDLDESALSAARHAAYSPRDVENLPPHLLSKYFEQSGGQYLFQRELRRCVIFGRHNVVFDAPISRIDLLLCRNLLIYLETETQEVVLPRLHYALVDNGFLFLGKAETQLARSKLFTAVDTRHRMFSKVPQEWRRSPSGHLVLGADPVQTDSMQQLRTLEAVVDAVNVAYLVVDSAGQLVFGNAAARRLLDVGEADIGKPFQDLSISYRPSELRSRLDEMRRDLRPQRIEHVEHHRPPGESIRVTIELTPLFGRDGALLAALLGFQDTTRVYQLQRELEAAQESLETTIEELQSANEELETTNEELQSTNEELETTNEELQSTNEELETMNEELQSTNEELETTNEELRRQTDEANRYRLHSESVLKSVSFGVVVIDSCMQVQSWNRWSENAWGLRSEEVLGRRLVELDIGLPVVRLAEPIGRVLGDASDLEDLVLDGIDRRGRPLHCRVRITPQLHGEDFARGAILCIEAVGAA